MSAKTSRKDTTPRVSAPAAAAPWWHGRSSLIAVALVLLATLRIVATYDVFSHTSDEPNHIACGLEYLDKGAYTYEPQHPPLARIAAALGPYLLGARSQGRIDAANAEDAARQGLGILYHGEQYDRNLFAARAGILPFFWIACLAVYLLGLEVSGPLCALAALFLFTFEPSVLAHSGLATTDIPVTAFLTLASAMALRLVRRRTHMDAVLLGASVGLAILSKFSALPYLAAIAAALLACAAWRHRDAFLPTARALLPAIAISAVTAATLIALAYRFQFQPLTSGIAAVIEHNKTGHLSYLLGEIRTQGFWYFYPVVLAVKLPLALLALFAAGLATRPKNLWIPLAIALPVLAVAMAANINIGVRHVLPMYPGIIVIAAFACTRQTPRWHSFAVAALLVTYAGASLLAHPDYLPYFNALAGSEPEKITVDSNLDWGQDRKRLARRMKELNAPQLAFDPFFLADPARAGLPPLQSTLDGAKPGWNAVSLTYWKAYRLGNWRTPDIPLWPDRFPPTERVGKSILIYNLRRR